MFKRCNTEEGGALHMKISYTPQDIPFTIGNINCVGVMRPGGYKVSFFEGRKQHSFLYTANGTMRYSFVGKVQEDIVASAGELVFIPATTRHSSLYMDPENTVEIVQFDHLTGSIPNYLSCPSLIRNDAAGKIFRSLSSDLQSGEELNSLYFLSQIYGLLWHISRNSQNIPRKYSRLQLVLKELHLTYSEQYKIQYYADLCGMSEPGFRRLFKEYTGVSPVEYRNRMRLQAAKKMLGSGEFTVEEVAEKVGFSNVSFFCRTYKKQFGHSPGKDS